MDPEVLNSSIFSMSAYWLLQALEPLDLEEMMKDE